MGNFRLVAAVAASAMAFSATAATNGSKGGTSTGTVNVSAGNSDLIQISQIQNDIDLGTWTGQASLSGSTDACVWTNSDINQYSITATASATVQSAAGAFELSDGTDSLPFTLNWNDGTTATNLTSGAAATFGSTVNSANCTNGTALNTTITVTVDTADLEAVDNRGSNYTGTLTLVVSPL